jgi:uncharacterized 2Fe-2S/4Fe-4S cluster protein (DUF4445 family)
MDQYQVTFMPENVTVNIKKGTNLLMAAKKAGIDIESPCGGNGTCGKCAVRIISGSFETQNNMYLPWVLRDSGYVRACHTKVKSDMVVEVPMLSRLSRHEVVIDSKKTKFSTEEDYFSKNVMNPICKKYHVQLKEPDVTDNMSDLDRLKKVLEKEHGIGMIIITLGCLRELSRNIRQGNWEITVTISNANNIAEIVAIEPGKSAKPTYGMAVDIGTTTVAVSLLDTDSGKIIDKSGTYNKQAVYGSDVISRIIYTDENKNGLELLQKAVVETVNELVDCILKKNGLEPKDIPVMVCAGNTVMTHMLLGVTASYLRLEPYIPSATKFPAFKAKELNININSDGAVVTIPSVASYVGGDITSGVLATMLCYSDELTLFVDIGTNGELVLGNRDWLVTCSCSAGPAFEGSGISCGMRAMNGAIDRIEIDSDSLKAKYKVIGDCSPLGICGSGLICSLSRMMKAGIIDRAGKIFTNKTSKRVRIGTDGLEYILVFAEESGTAHNIAITENDIKNLLRAKGAIFAGIRTLLQMVDLHVKDIGRIYIAGGFGNYINIADAVGIGMFPDLPEDKYEYVGNSCIQGAMIVLLCQEAMQEAESLADMMTYLELSVGNQFMEEFISAMFIPHTDLSLFPTLENLI